VTNRGLISSQNVYAPFMLGLNMLKDLVDHIYSKSPTDDDFTNFAETVSEIAGKKKPWKFKYMKGCYYEYANISPSKKLVRALQILANRLDGQGDLQSRVRPVADIYSPNGLLPNSVILGSTVYCAYCQVKFVPRSGNGKYCCKQHRRKFYREKAKARN